MTLLKILHLHLFALLAALLFPAAAFAVEAAATVDLNVRTGPSTSYGVVDTLDVGEVVNVGECASNGWCYIYQEGPNGWVSSNFLTATTAAAPGGSSDPDCSLSLTIGAGGTPSLTLNCGTSTPAAPAPAPAPGPAPVGDQACFYTNNNYTGAEFCYGTGSLNSLNATFNDRISSVKLFGAAKAKLCRNTNLGGVCRLVGADVPLLGAAINDKASSVLVFTGAPPAPAPAPGPVAPVTHSTGLINLKQTFTADLDTGNTGGAGADIWYQAVTAVEKYITPRNGAKLSLGNGSNRGLAGCRTASYSSGRLSIWVLPVGTYVCVKTAQGRFSQFRLNGYSGTTMKLGYTTWAN